MGYKAVINDPSYLCHFNPFHSRKNGQFTFRTDPNKIEVAKRDVDITLSNRSEAVNKVKEKGQKLIDTANNLGEEYKKAFSKVKLDDTSRKQILDGLEEDFGKVNDPRYKTRFEQIKASCDDDEYFGLVLDEHVDRAIFNQLKNNKKLSDMSSDFEDLKESYWKDVHAVVDDLTKKYENIEFGFANNYIYGNKMETSVPSYITRHFDDYWVNDTDEHYAAIERLKKELEDKK